jgi:membrane-associated protein
MHDWLEWLRGLHSAEGISQLLGKGGLAVIVAIIFAETGLLVGFFLPGDSLLITAGVLANPLNPNHLQALDIWVMNGVLFLAAVTGDQVGYRLGRRTGDAIWTRKDGRLYKRRHLEAAHDFYERYGALSVVAARYVPIVRTFVPFVAGVARMEPRRFVFWNLLGGFLWITSLLWVGYFLGQTPLANRLDKIIVIVIFVSFLPMIVGVAKGMLGGKAGGRGKRRAPAKRRAVTDT